MSDIKSLADELRSKITAPEPVTAKPEVKKKTLTDAPEPAVKSANPVKNLNILEQIRFFDNADHKSMVHVRFDARTVQTMNQFKMATGVDVTKLVAFAVRELFAVHPELKTMIKQFMQKLD